jgi:hypothetical protein
MAGSTSEQIANPTFDHFALIKDAFLEVAREPDAVCRVDEGGMRLFVQVERLFSDFDLLAWPPLMVCVSGLLRTMPGGNTLTIRYRELPLHADTINSSVNHDYGFESWGEELVDYWHSVRACPEITELPGRPVYDQLAYQADQGREILQKWSAAHQEPTAGDCGVLFDRMAALVG